MFRLIHYRIYIELFVAYDCTINIIYTIVSRSLFNPKALKCISNMSQSEFCLRKDLYDGCETLTLNTRSVRDTNGDMRLSTVAKSRLNWSSVKFQNIKSRDLRSV